MTKMTKSEAAIVLQDILNFCDAGLEVPQSYLAKGYAALIILSTTGEE